MTFQTPGMRKKERVMDARASRPVTIQTVLIKARFAGYGTDDGRDGAPARIVAAIDGVGQVTAQLTQFDTYVFAHVERPAFDTKRVRLHTIQEVQAFIKGLGKAEATRK